MKKKKILVITPVKHIKGVVQILEEIGEVIYLDDPKTKDIIKQIKGINAIFTNPNKSKIFLGENTLSQADSLEVICTASTGTNHIDKEFTKSRNIKIISLTEERDVINKISSTAEHAFALTLTSIRKIKCANDSVMNNEWDYTKFIGRQINKLNFGIIGFGRLGKYYADYCKAFGAKVYVYDPYKYVEDEKITQVHEIEEIFNKSDVISLHVHVNKETTNMINKDCLKYAKDELLIVNTSRGEIINENDLVQFLKDNKLSKVATDVLKNEIQSKETSPLLLFSKQSSQVLITPHIGGMTKEAQEIAYGHAANLLKRYKFNFQKLKK